MRLENRISEEDFRVLKQTLPGTKWCGIATGKLIVDFYQKYIQELDKIEIRRIDEKSVEDKEREEKNLLGRMNAISRFAREYVDGPYLEPYIVRSKRKR